LTEHAAIIFAGLSIMAVILLIFVIRAGWHIPRPDEALIVTGRQAGGTPSEATAWRPKIVVAQGVFALPGMNRVNRLDLSSYSTDLSVDCVTKQAVWVKVTGVVLFKVGDDETSITNAARRFMHNQDQMGDTVHEVFAGHLRAIVGQIKVEELITDRERLAELTRQNSSVEMQKLGLVIDSLQIEHIEDPSDYNRELERPYRAAVQQLAVKAEQDAREANAKDQERGAIAEELMQQNVLAEQAKRAELEAELEERRLLATIRKPADAQKYRRISEAEAGAKEVRLHAEAEADAVRVRADAAAYEREVLGNADAEAIRRKGLAEAETIKARAEALSINADAVIGQQLAERWPDIVDAAAESISSADQLIVLNGAEGLSQILAQTLASGAQGLKLTRALLSGRSPDSSNHSKSVANDGDADAATSVAMHTPRDSGEPDDQRQKTP
jgi:flotillin